MVKISIVIDQHKIDNAMNFITDLQQANLLNKDGCIEFDNTDLEAAHAFKEIIQKYAK